MLLVCMFPQWQDTSGDALMVGSPTMPSLLTVGCVDPCCLGNLGCCAIGFWCVCVSACFFTTSAMQQSAVIVGGQPGHAWLCDLNCGEALFHYGEHTCFGIRLLIVKWGKDASCKTHG